VIPPLRPKPPLAVILRLAPRCSNRIIVIVRML